MQMVGNDMDLVPPPSSLPVFNDALANRKGVGLVFTVTKVPRTATRMQDKITTHGMPINAFTKKLRAN
jgi:hypothetical protein